MTESESQAGLPPDFKLTVVGQAVGAGVRWVGHNDRSDEPTRDILIVSRTWP